MVQSGNSSPPFAAWRTVIENFISDQLGDDPDGLTARVAAAATQAATMSALAWWGVHSDGDAAEAVDRALRELGAGFTRRRG